MKKTIIKTKMIRMRKSNLLFGLVILILSLSFYPASDMAAKQKEKDESFAPLFPFLISYDTLADATSMAHLLDAPAGKYGFIRIERGHFVNDAGRINFNGTNLTGPANFPTHAEADLVAARLAHLGINCVRLHYMDDVYGNFRNEPEAGIIARDPLTQRNLDASQVEKLDYLIAALKKKGIYVNINLHVARFWDERDGFSGKDKRPWADKGLDNFEPRMIELQKEYARKLLTHVNSYTGLAYTDDPCVAMVEINNENALLNQFHNGAIDRLPEPYASEFQKQWNDWLHKKYPSGSALLEGWKEKDSASRQETSWNINPLKGYQERNIPVLPNKKGYAPKEVAGDFYQFLVDTEYKYWTGIYHFLKKELKVKSVVSGTQLGYSPPFVQARLDYIDNHSYWCHPGPVNPNWRIRNESMVNSMACIRNLASQRIDGKPYTISEYNHPFPNLYGAEGQPMLRAYGRLQGWDGVFEYTYNHRSDFSPNHINYFFSMIARTDVLGHFPACAAMYLRGDVREAKSAVAIPLGYEEYFDRLVSKKAIGAGVDVKGVDQRYALLHQTTVQLKEGDAASGGFDKKIPDNQKVFVSDTKELTWNIEKQDSGYFTVNTPNTKLFTGFPAGRFIQLGNVGVSIGKTRLDWATLSFVSRNAAGFGEKGLPSSILLCATGLVENKGMVIKQVSGKQITLSNWGGEKMLAEGIPATIILPSDPLKTKCFALGPDGKRLKEVPVEKAGKGKAQITISPLYQTIWYEIEIR